MNREPDQHETAILNITRALAVGTLLIGGMIFGLTSTSVDAASVTLAWDAPANNPDGAPVTDLAGYRLYYGTATRAYSDVVTVGLAQTATITNLQQGVTYYISVVAYNEAGSEGSYSEELIWTDVHMSVAPAAGGVGGAGIVLQWTSATNEYFTVLRSTNLMANPAFSTLASHVPGTGAITSYADTSATANGPYFYKIQVEL